MTVCVRPHNLDWCQPAQMGSRRVFAILVRRENRGSAGCFDHTGLKARRQEYRTELTRSAGPRACYAVETPSRARETDKGNSSADHCHAVSAR